MPLLLMSLVVAGRRLKRQNSLGNIGGAPCGRTLLGCIFTHINDGVASAAVNQDSGNTVKRIGRIRIEHESTSGETAVLQQT
jgi:hypothetical protein